jgi:hypothetical protein
MSFTDQFLTKSAGLWVLAFLSVLVLLMKPLHLGDFYFFQLAQLLVASTETSQGNTLNWMGQVLPHFNLFESANPPLIPYYLKGISTLFGWAQTPTWLFRLAFLPFPLLVFWSGRSFSRLLSLPPYWVGMLLTSPLFFLPAQTLTNDVPHIAFWLSSMAQAYAFCHSGRERQGLLLSVLLFLALMTNYLSLFLLPPLLALVLLKHKTTSAMVYLAVPVFLLILYFFVVYQATGTGPFRGQIHPYFLDDGGLGLIRNAITVLAAIGMGLFPVTPMLFFAIRKRHLVEILVSASVITFAVFHTGRQERLLLGYASHELLLLRLLMITGGVWLFFILMKLVNGIARVTQDPEEAGVLIVCSLWMLSVGFYCLFLIPDVSTRHLLPAMIPCLILLTLQTEDRPIRHQALPFTLLMLGCSAFLAFSDFQQAIQYQNLAQSIRNFTSKEHPFYFADNSAASPGLAAAGGVYLGQHGMSLEADALILETHLPLNPLLKSQCDLVHVFPQAHPWLFSLQGSSHRAGFFYSENGLLPFNFRGEEPIGTLWRVNSVLQAMEGMAPSAKALPMIEAKAQVRWPRFQDHAWVPLRAQQALRFNLAKAEHPQGLRGLLARYPQDKGTTPLRVSFVVTSEDGAVLRRTQLQMPVEETSMMFCLSFEGMKHPQFLDCLLVSENDHALVLTQTAWESCTEAVSP